MKLSPRQLESVAAQVSTGSMKGAAHELGISESSLSKHLADARRKLGCDTTTQAVYILTARGELVVPGRG